MLPAEEMHELLAGIDPSSLLGLRDRTPYVGHDSRILLRVMGRFRWVFEYGT